MFHLPYYLKNITDREFLKNGFRMVSDRFIWLLLGHKNYIKISFRRIHSYRLDLNNPVTLSEKVRWITLYGNLERFSEFVDKYKVRKFVRERIGEKYLIPLIGHYNRTDEIDFDSLPQSFIMKATHGSGWNFRVVDKSTFNWMHAKRKMARWLRANYYHRYGEPNYKPLKGGIIIEKLLQDSAGDCRDYKFYCRNGEPMFIQVDRTRFSDHRGDVYDMEWNRIPLTWGIDNFSQPMERPGHLEEMLELSRRLSKDFPFVRVDLYCPDDQIFFGELTFTPGDGLQPVEPFESNVLLGRVIDTSLYNQSDSTEKSKAVNINKYQ